MEPPAPAYVGDGLDREKHDVDKDYTGENGALGSSEVDVEEGQGKLRRGLHGRHMQMIAIGMIRHRPSILPRRF